MYAFAGYFVLKFLPRFLEEIDCYEVVIRSSSDVSFLHCAECAPKRKSSDIVGEREVRLKCCRRGDGSSVDYQFQDKVLKARDKAKDFFRSPYNYCEHRAFVALMFLLDAMNHLEFEDSQHYKCLSKAHNAFYKRHLTMVLREMLEDPEVLQLNVF